MSSINRAKGSHLGLRRESMPDLLTSLSLLNCAIEQDDHNRLIRLRALRAAIAAEIEQICAKK